MKYIILIIAAIFATPCLADSALDQINSATAAIDAATSMVEHIGLLLAGIVAVSAHARALIPPTAINPTISKALDAAGGNYGNAKNNDSSPAA